MYTGIYCSREIAKIIIEQEKWKKSLKNGTTAENGTENTPFRRLVRLMPGTVTCIYMYICSTVESVLQLLMHKQFVAVVGSLLLSK